MSRLVGRIACTCGCPSPARGSVRAAEKRETRALLAQHLADEVEEYLELLHDWDVL